jgi:hypothetical protein
MEEYLHTMQETGFKRKERGREGDREEGRKEREKEGRKEIKPVYNSTIHNIQSGNNLNVRYLQNGVSFDNKKERILINATACTNLENITK